MQTATRIDVHRIAREAPADVRTVDRYLAGRWCRTMVSQRIVDAAHRLHLAHLLPGDSPASGTRPVDLATLTPELETTIATGEQR